MTDAAPPAPLRRAVRIAPLSMLRLSAFNARTVEPNEDEIASLADTIDPEIGLLQNLVGRPEGTAIGVFAGGRRLRALWLQRDRGLISPDYGVPILVRDFTDAEALKYSTIENDRREALSFLEQADAYARLVAMGISIETLALEGGHPPGFVRGRVALHHRLAPALRRALAEGRLNLGQAEAFTVGDHERQAELLPAVIQFPQQYRPAAIKAALIGSAIPLSRAIFDPALYTGGRRRDFFSGEEEYADDRAEFARLQREAVAARVLVLAREWLWTEVRIGAAPDLTKFAPGAPPSEGGAIVHLRDDLSVAVHTGLGRSAALARTAPASLPGRVPAPAGGDGSTGAAASGALPPPPVFTREHLAWARDERLARLIGALGARPDVATALAILDLLGVEIIGAGTRPALPQRALDALVAEWGEAVEYLGEGRPDLAFELIMDLSDNDRGLLLAAVAECRYAGSASFASAAGDPALGIAVAAALNAAVPAAFMMKAPYLERLGLPALALVAAGCGADIAGLDRGEAIDRILLTARDPGWVPPELCFGAVADRAEGRP